jgi:hypothetical protein
MSTAVPMSVDPSDPQISIDQILRTLLQNTDIGDNVIDPNTALTTYDNNDIQLNIPQFDLSSLLKEDSVLSDMEMNKEFLAKKLKLMDEIDATSKKADLKVLIHTSLKQLIFR